MKGGEPYSVCERASEFVVSGESEKEKGPERTAGQEGRNIGRALYSLESDVRVFHVKRWRSILRGHG